MYSGLYIWETICRRLKQCATLIFYVTANVIQQLELMWDPVDEVAILLDAHPDRTRWISLPNVKVHDIVLNLFAPDLCGSDFSSQVDICKKKPRTSLLCSAFDPLDILISECFDIRVHIEQTCNKDANNFYFADTMRPRDVELAHIEAMPYRFNQHNRCWRLYFDRKRFAYQQRPEHDIKQQVTL
jgi:hypothetical protein